MSYNAISIKNIVGKISNNEVYLPAIQRRFVWNSEQIEKLFDSIMLGYPIGTFLFWKVEKTKANDYTFYKFIQEYHERDKYLNELAPKPEMRDWIIGVLDGQQRLSSMYLALQGSYSYKKPRARRDNNDAYPKRLFYLNLLRGNFNEEEGTTYEFKFLTDEEASVVDDSQFWFPVREALNWKDASDYIAFAASKNYLLNSIFVKNLTDLWQRISQDEIVNYFEVKAQDLDSILDIFIRVNSGGTVLSKSDLLFSTIVANWEKAREEIEELLKNINSKGERFNFDNDFIMRSCLVLTDSPVLFRVKNFKKDHIEKIKDNWSLIKDSLIRTVNLLVEFGFNQDYLKSHNAIIPIAYYLFKGGILNDDTRKKIRIFLITSLLKQVFGANTDQVLDSIRHTLRKEVNGSYILKNQSFDYQSLLNYRTPTDKTLVFTNEDLDNLFDNKKSPYTFMVLSLLYPHLKLRQVQFHQDHLHPASSFSNSNLRDNLIDENKWLQWQEDKDKLANLQLLEGQENEIKSKTPLDAWIKSGVQNPSAYKVTNYIPDTDLSLSNFEEFIRLRKELMKSKLKNFLYVMNGT